jgi:nitrous oxidase accessory protein NosD
MKNLRTLSSLFGAAFLLISSVLGDTAITAVPITIKNAGVYVLTANLTYTGGGNAIEVAAPDVTIDFQGYRIEGPSQTGNAVGVYVNNQSDVTVEGGTLENFGTAILFFSTSNPNSAESVQSMRIVNSNFGIVLDYPTASTIQNNAIYTYSGVALPAGGIALNSSAGGNSILHNVVTNCTTGISTDGDCYLLENFVTGYGAGATGINMATSDKYRFNVVMNTGTSYSGGTALTDDNN